MVAIHPKKSFKTTVSIVSSNVFQKVVTIKNQCSTTAAPPPPPEIRKHVPTEVRVPPRNTTLREDLCCSIPVPLTITVTDEDVASELSCELTDVQEERPPTPRPSGAIRNTWRNFCLSETTQGAFALPTLPTNSMEWPSDEEEGDNEDYSGESTNLAFAAAKFLPVAPKFDSVCGLHFCSPNRQTTTNTWGLMVADRDDVDEGRSRKEVGMASSGSTYEYREPMVTLRDPFFSI